MKNRIIAGLLGGLLYMLPTLPTLAAPITLEVSATVDYVWDPSNTLGGTIAPGTVITGIYTYDDSLPDTDLSINYGYYQHPYESSGFGFDLSAGGHDFKTGPLSSNFNLQLYDGPYFDSYRVMSNFQNLPLANGSPIHNIFIDLYDHTATALSSDRLAGTLPVLGAYENRDLLVDGQNATLTEYFHFHANITNIAVSTGGVPGLPTFKLSATVSDVYDPANALGGAIQLNDTISGTYAFDPATPDSDGSPDFGKYIHPIGSAGVGFDLTANGLNFKTDSSLGEFRVELYNSTTSYASDFYDAYSWGMNLPLANGATVDGIDLHFYDPNGVALTSAALTDTLPPLSSWMYADVVIYGRHPNGVDNYHIVTKINAIEAVTDSADAPVVIAPGSGTYVQYQNFDIGIIFDAGLAPMLHMQGTLNGRDITPYLYNCMPGAPNPQQRQTFICPALNTLLQSGSNTLSLRFDMADGTSHNQSVTLEVLGY